MFVNDQLGDRTGIHPVQDFDRAIGAGRGDPAENGFRLVVAKGTRHHIADIVAGAKTKACLFLDDRQEFVENPVHRILVKPLHRIHGGAKMLHFARRQVADDFRSLVFSDQHHQDG